MLTSSRFLDETTSVGSGRHAHRIQQVRDGGVQQLVKVADHTQEAVQSCDTASAGGRSISLIMLSSESSPEGKVLEHTWGS